MRWALFFPALAAANPLFPRAACPNNACLHSMLSVATMPAGSLVADCSHYFQTTITPPASTITKVVDARATGTNTMHVYILTYTTTTVFTTGTLTTTQTITGTTQIQESSTSVPALFQRQVATSLPPYASVCGGTADYGAACVCLGVKPVTKTLPVSKTTTTVTSYNTVKTVTLVTTDLTVTHGITQTATTSATATVSTYTVETAVNFVLQASTSLFVSQYGIVGWNSEATRNDMSFTTDGTQATVFYIDEASKLVDAGTGNAAYCALNQATAVIFDDAATNHAHGWSPATCKIMSDLSLHCTCGGGITVSAVGWTVTDSPDDRWAWILVPPTWNCAGINSCLTLRAIAMVG